MENVLRENYGCFVPFAAQVGKALRALIGHRHRRTFSYSLIRICVQHLAQGHFSMQTRRERIRSSNPPCGRRPTVLPEPHLQVEVGTKVQSCFSFLLFPVRSLLLTLCVLCAPPPLQILHQPPPPTCQIIFALLLQLLFVVALFAHGFLYYEAISA